MSRYSGAVTPRQAEILRLVAEGYSNKQVGDVLGLSLQTVKRHVSEVIARLDAVDRTSAVVRGMAAGVVPVPVSVGTGESWTLP